MVKLSELSDDVLIGQEDSGTQCTVAEMKREILEFGEPHHEYRTYYILKEHRWKPSAEYMIERYIESEYDHMYEDWSDRAFDCIKENDCVRRIQEILDEALTGDYVSKYWTCEQAVEIDIRPKAIESTETA
ncbi:hypothetical protein [Paenibacillus kobensis]|uniref:hypothetical protein n=1 Tax=Paenibacillus kobensis TaxID=59841 RepID=UPI000FD99C6F|nr:hypothetical protein [Paenibacillus kobensis]